MGVFLFSKSKFANRAAGKEVMQMPRMPKYLKREWAFFLGYAKGRARNMESLCTGKGAVHDLKDGFKVFSFLSNHELYTVGQLG